MMEHLNKKIDKEEHKLREFESVYFIKISKRNRVEVSGNVGC
jgi:hypothetical protein